MKMTYLTQPPKRYTFEQPKLRAWVESFCEQPVLNLFAGRTPLSIPEFRVDIEETMPADVHADSYEFICNTRRKFKTVILDPPYNIRKAREKYEGRWIGRFTKIKNKLNRVLLPDAVVITLGYDTVGMSKSRGFEKIAVCVVCHNGDHNDTLTLVEKKLGV
jgi:hypothetical protein